MSARWSVLLGVVAGLAASGAALAASVSATSGRTSTDPVAEVAGGRGARKGHLPRYRYIFSSEPAQAAAASHGWNLLDVSSQLSADQLPGPTRAMMYAGDYDNSTCEWEVSDSELTPPSSVENGSAAGRTAAAIPAATVERGGRG